MELNVIQNYILQSKVFCKKMQSCLQANDDKDFFESVANRLNTLEKDAQKGELYVLVAGEVKMGKSSTINNILDEDVCTVDQAVCTNVVSVIRYGQIEKYVLHFFPTESNENPDVKEVTREELNEYVSEGMNPKNVKQVKLVEVYLPNKVLDKGLVFIDTPGLGAIDPKHAVATYEIAARADIILFVTNTMKPISASELDHLHRLSECSNSKKVFQLMTRADESDAEILLEKNKEFVNGKYPELDVKYFKLSNTFYRDYKATGDKDDLEESGFEELFIEINEVNDSIQGVLCCKYFGLLMQVLQNIHTNLASIVEYSSNPNFAEKRVRELQELMKRIQKLQSSSHVWRNSLSGKVSHLQNDLVFAWIQNKRTETLSFLDGLLQDSFYLRNLDSLGYELQVKLEKNTKELQALFNRQAEVIYKDIVSETELGNIRKLIHSNKIKATSNVDIEVNSSFEELVFDLRNVGIGVVSGMAIGGMVGSLIPIIGNVIGAAIGGLLGWIASKFISDERKRRKIKEKVSLTLNTFFTQLSTSLNDVYIDFKQEIQTSFETELAEELTTCKQQKAALEKLVEGDGQYREYLKTAMQRLDNFIGKLKNDK